MIVYTTVFGTTHRLRRQPQFDGVEYVCFTDRDLDVPGWHYERVTASDPLMTCKGYKLRPHRVFPDAAETLWLDSRIALKCDPRTIPQGDFCVSPHRVRTNITDEAGEIIRLGRADPASIRAQLAAYRAEGFVDTTLAEVGAMLRRHTSIVRDVCERWYREVTTRSPRDQMSLGYVCWKTGFTPTFWNKPLSRSPYFDLAKASQW